MLVATFHYNLHVADAIFNTMISKRYFQKPLARIANRALMCKKV
jgi:hypothetical protein